MKAFPDGFMDFWTYWRQYKRHTDGPNKNKLQQRYQEALDMGATPEDILLAAHYHVRNFKDLAWIELAATWLGAGLWMDEAPKEREYQSKLTASKGDLTNVTPIRPAPVHQTAFLRAYNAKREA